MAFVSKETAKVVRQSLKKEFPSTKFSVRGSGGHTLIVVIKKSDLFESQFTQVNHHFIENDERFNQDQKDFLIKMVDTVRKAGGHFDESESDSMTDYFHCAFCEHYSIDTKVK